MPELQILTAVATLKRQCCITKAYGVAVHDALAVNMLFLLEWQALCCMQMS